jgi:hypothetical protein
MSYSDRSIDTLDNDRDHLHGGFIDHGGRSSDQSSVQKPQSLFAASVNADQFLVPPSSVPRRARSHGNRVRNLPDRTTNHAYTPSTPSAALDLANTKRPVHGRMTDSALPRFQIEDADRLSYHFNERNSAVMHYESAVYDDTDMSGSETHEHPPSKLKGTTTAISEATDEYEFQHLAGSGEGIGTFSEQDYLQRYYPGADYSRPHLDQYDYQPSQHSVDGNYLPHTRRVEPKNHGQSSFKKSSTLYPGDGDFETSLSRLLGDRESAACTIRIEPIVTAFISSQFALGDGMSICNFVVLTGGTHGIWASTCAEYVSEHWPGLSSQIIEVFDVLVKSLNRSIGIQKHTVSFGELGYSLQLTINRNAEQDAVHPSMFETWPEVQLFSSPSILTSITNAISWFCTTMQPTQRGLAYCACSLTYKTSEDGKAIFNIMGENQASLLKYREDWPSNCWMPLVPNFSVAGDHASRPRRPEIKGMEVSFELMCYLCGLEYEVLEGDGLVLYGTKSMVYPVRQLGDCVEWHFEALDGQSPPVVGTGQRLAAIDLTVLCDRTRHFVGLWKEPLITLGTDSCDPCRIEDSGLPTKDTEMKNTGRTIGATISPARYLGLHWSENFDVIDTRKNPYTAGAFLPRLSDMRNHPVLLYSLSERRAWMVSFVSVLWHLARAKAHTHHLLGYSVPACEEASDGGTAAMKQILKCYKNPVKNDIPKDELDEAERAYTIEDYLKEVWADLDTRARECHRKRGIFTDQMLGYDMVDIVRPRPSMHMKACNLKPSGWTPLLEQVPYVLFCEALQDPIIAGHRRTKSHCLATKWDSIPKGFDILTASLPCLKHACAPSNNGGSIAKISRNHLWHVPNCSSSHRSGRVFTSCECAHGSSCNKLQEVRSRINFSGPIMPPSLTDISNHKNGAVIFRYKDDIQSIQETLRSRQLNRNELLRPARDPSAEQSDSGYSSRGTEPQRGSRRIADSIPTPAAQPSREPTPTSPKVQVDKPKNTYPKILKKDIEVQTLDRYHLPWELDPVSQLSNFMHY